MNPMIQDAPAPEVASDAPQAVPVTESGDAPSQLPEGEAPAPDSPQGDTSAPETPAPKDEPAAKSGLQKRIDQLVREKHEAQRALEAERLERLREQAQVEAIDQVRAIDQQEPKLDQFETTQDYMAAHARWASQRALTVMNAQANLKSAESLIQRMDEDQKAEQHRGRLTEVSRQIDQKLGPGVKKYADFAQVLGNPELQSSIGTPLFDAVMNSDNAVDIAYSLGKNPSEYHRLLELSMRSPMSAYKEILALDAKFSGASKVTSAPAPPPELKGTPPVQKRLADADYDEFVRIRRKQIAARQR